MQLTVVPGQSLETIARERLPSGASRSQLDAAVSALAKANGLSTEAGLEVGRVLTIPDSFQGTISRDADTGGAIPRLLAGGRTDPAWLRSQKKAGPLVPLRAAFSSPERQPVGAVALPPVTGAPVEGVEFRFGGVASPVDPTALLGADGKLGKLTAPKFAEVKKALGGRSAVSYDSAREYSISDFLPPKLQALVNRDLEVPEPVTLKGTKKIGVISGDEDKSIGLTMNCHAAAWEAVRAYQGKNQECAIFYGEMIVMDERTHIEADFEKVAELDGAQITKLLEKDLRPGDIVQFHEVSDWMRMTMLLHSAVYVGGGLFFEKPNTEGAEVPVPEKWIKQDETPFRLATLAHMVTPVSAFVDGKFRVEVLRAKKELADPAEAFGSSLTPEFEAHAKKKGKALGVELVCELEQGLGGNIKAEYASALVRVPLARAFDGSGVLEEG